MIKATITFFLGICLFTSCRHSCVNTFISPIFIGYDPADIDTLVFRAYKPNDNYQHLVDTELVLNAGANIFTTSNDSTIVYINSSNPDHNINQNFDWIVYVPATNQQVSVSNITSGQTSSTGTGTCFNPINSIVQNGLLVPAQFYDRGKFYNSGYFFFIHK
jgi:hypothetical protein